MTRFGTFTRLLVAVLLGMGLSRRVSAETMTTPGQLLFVPIYSELPYGDRRHTLNLSATLSIRNTDRKNPLTLKRVDYYSAVGALVRSYVSKPLTVAPMASIEYIVSGADRSGGTAASFLVEWESAAALSVPVVEAVMIGAASTYGISFLSSGRVVEEKR